MRRTDPFCTSIDQAREDASLSGKAVLPRVRERTANLFGRSTATVGRLVSEWNRSLPKFRANTREVSNFVFNSNRKGNRFPKECRSSNNEVVCAVRDFVRQKRINRARITATEVLAFFSR